MSAFVGIRSQNPFPVDRAAFALGIGEFSLFWRIRGDEITTVRAKSGEMMVPQTELERLSCLLVNPESFAAVTTFPDERLGIERLTGDGEGLAYKVLGTEARFTKNEVNSYRAAYGAIAREFESLSDLKKQLMNRSNQVSHFCDVQVNSPGAGLWEVRSVLLNLNPGEILLCYREDRCAVIEHFQGGSPYAKSNGNAQILLQGDDAQEMAAEFKVEAQHTLEFMASNLTAKAQKIAWQQFPNHRPGCIVAAISERCHRAVSNEVRDLPTIERLYQLVRGPQKKDADRLTAEEAAWLLGFSPHEIPILVEKGLLKPLDSSANDWQCN